MYVEIIRIKAWWWIVDQFSCFGLKEIDNAPMCWAAFSPICYLIRTPEPDSAACLNQCPLASEETCTFPPFGPRRRKGPPILSITMQSGFSLKSLILTRVLITIIPLLATFANLPKLSVSLLNFSFQHCHIFLLKLLFRIVILQSSAGDHFRLRLNRIGLHGEAVFRHPRMQSPFKR